MVVIDLEPLYVRQSYPRFVLRADVDEFNSTVGHGSWRQMKPFNKLWGTGAGAWETLPDGRILFKNSAEHRNISGAPCSLVNSQGASLKEFPVYGQYGLGHFYGIPKPDESQPRSRFLWVIDNVDFAAPDPRYLWVGIGGKFGGHAAVHRREFAYGFIANAADLTKIWEIGFTGSGWGPGLGGSTGMFLIVVTGQNPKEIVGTTSSQWDFNFAFAGKIDGYLKAANAALGAPAVTRLGRIAQEIMKDAKLGRAGERVHEALPGLSKSGLLESFMNGAKTICNGLVTDWGTPGFSLLDLPVTTPGLELGLLHTTTKVEDSYPLLA
jgi:hypothetical protein